MRSVYEQPAVLASYIERELSQARVLGPLPLELSAAAHISPCKVIPKSQPGKWRLTVDLSAPEGASINDGIPKELCSPRYVSVDDIVGKVVQLGRGCLLAKMDLESAYRMVPVHPDDRLLLGMSYDDNIYINGALPFGLRHACKVVRPGKRFLRGIFQLLAACHRKHHYIRLSAAFRADLEWWHSFLGEWNGTSLLFPLCLANPDGHVWSDASGSWGGSSLVPGPVVPLNVSKAEHKICTAIF